MQPIRRIIVRSIEVVNRIATAAADRVNEDVRSDRAVEFIRAFRAVDRTAARPDRYLVRQTRSDDRQLIRPLPSVDSRNRRAVFSHIQLFRIVTVVDRNRRTIRRERHAREIVRLQVFRQIRVAVLTVDRAVVIHQCDRIGSEIDQHRAVADRNERRAVELAAHAVNVQNVAVALSVAVNGIIPRTDRVHENVRALAAVQLIRAAAAVERAVATAAVNLIRQRVARDVQFRFLPRAVNRFERAVLTCVEIAVAVIVRDRHGAPRGVPDQFVRIECKRLPAVIDVELAARIDECQRVFAQVDINPTVTDIQEIRRIERIDAVKHHLVFIAVIVVDHIAPRAERVHEHVLPLDRAAVQLIVARTAVECTAARAEIHRIVEAVADDLQIILITRRRIDHLQLRIRTGVEVLAFVFVIDIRRLSIRTEIQAVRIVGKRLPVIVIERHLAFGVHESQSVLAQDDIDIASDDRNEIRAVERAHAVKLNLVVVILAVIVVDRIRAGSDRVHKNVVILTAVEFVVARAAVHHRPAAVHRDDVRVFVADQRDACRNFIAVNVLQSRVFRAVKFILGVLAVNRHVLHVAAERRARKVDIQRLTFILHIERRRRRIHEIQCIVSEIEVDSTVAEIHKCRAVERSHAGDRNLVAGIVIVHRVSALPDRVHYHVVAVTEVNPIGSLAAVDICAAVAERDHIRLAVADDRQAARTLRRVDRHDRIAVRFQSRHVKLGVGIIVVDRHHRARAVYRQAFRQFDIRVPDQIGLVFVCCHAFSPVHFVLLCRLITIRAELSRSLRVSSSSGNSTPRLSTASISPSGSPV